MTLTIENVDKNSVRFVQFKKTLLKRVKLKYRITELGYVRISIGVFRFEDILVITCVKNRRYENKKYSLFSVLEHLIFNNR